MILRIFTILTLVGLKFAASLKLEISAQEKGCFVKEMKDVVPLTSYSTVVVNKECIDCKQNGTGPIWLTGPWKPCDKICDEGKQTRQVVCLKMTDGQVEVLDDKECLDEKPLAEQSCMLRLCEEVFWVLTDWVGCDTCFSKVRTRLAVCATSDHKVVKSSSCSHNELQVLEEPCDLNKLPPCEVQWYATQWSNCSTPCGKGIQTRLVFCGMLDGDSVLKVPSERCELEKKHDDTRECEVKECSALWYAGSWTKCSKPCDGGIQHRRVMCLRGIEEAKDCSTHTVLDSTQACNLNPCN